MGEGGWKNDQEKVRTDLLPIDGLMEEAQVWTFGAKKYEPRNWEKGLAWSRPYGALLRHIWAWWSGEEFDPETGISHLAHASCCIRMLQCYRIRQVGEDDRPIRKEPANERHV